MPDQPATAPVGSVDKYYSRLVHSFDRLSPAQLDALCNVAFGGYGATCNRRTLAKLEDEGLIERVDETRADRFGTFVIHKWVMPLSVHIEFCKWCAAQEDAGSAVSQETASKGGSNDAH